MSKEDKIAWLGLAWLALMLPGLIVTLIQIPAVGVIVSLAGGVAVVLPFLLYPLKGWWAERRFINDMRKRRRTKIEC